MKTTISMIATVCLFFSLTSCGTNNNTESPANQPDGVTSSSKPWDNLNVSADGRVEGSDTAAAPTEEAAKTLVVYFSATGHTKAVAEKIVRLTGAELYEIVPAEPYTAADLNYNDDNSRANLETNDASARPAIGGEDVDLSSYDIVFLGYPLWWGKAPKIVNTFLDKYDLSGKVVMPFCTSGSSGVSPSVSAIRATEPEADVRDGLRASGANDSGIERWIADNRIGQ